MTNVRLNNLVLENAHIVFRNFEGRPDKYHARGGVRSFCVFLDDPKVVKQLQEDGWNVRILAAREEGDQPRHLLQVAVSYDHIPPKVYMVTSKKRTLLTEDDIGTLDHADIISADLVISPYQWSVNGNNGVKAYLKTLYATVEEDEFAGKYAQFDEPAADAVDTELPF